MSRVGATRSATVGLNLSVESSVPSQRPATSSSAESMGIGCELPPTKGTTVSRKTDSVRRELRVTLFTPAQAWRFRWSKWTDTPLPPDEPAGENPPDGAIIDYHLSRAASEAKLEIVDSTGRVIRTYSSRDTSMAPQDIGIVVPYRAQGRLVRQRLARRLGPVAARTVVADTVERMQGQERELVILSLTTGDPVFMQAVAGFLFQPQRLNVAITRATVRLIVIGPEPADLPPPEDETVAQWMAQYDRFVGQCRHAVLQP